MEFKIPFTSLSLSLNAPSSGLAPVGIKRPLITGRGMIDGQGRDMSNFRINASVFYSAYKNNADIFGCVREWSQNVGAAGYMLYDPRDPEAEVPDKVKAYIESVLNHDMPFRTLKTRMLQSLGIAGNAYLHKVKDGNGIVSALQPIDSRTIAIISDKHGVIYGYVQKNRNEAVKFDTDEIIAFKVDTDPDNELFGMSPLEPAIWEARIDASAMLSNYFFFENDAVPAVQYILEEGMSNEEIEKAMDLIRDQFKGVKNANKSGVLSGVKEVKTVGISQKDMEYLNGRRFTTEKICAAYGVPKFMLGYTDTVNNNNGTELLAKAHESTFEPLEEMIAATITRELIDADPALAGTVAFKFKTRLFERQADIERRALEEYRNGTITLRQYKKKTGQEITPEDEQEPNFDKYIIHQGASAVLLEDVGVEPILNPNDPATAANMVAALQTLRTDAED